MPGCDFDVDVCLGPRAADHGWGLGYMLNKGGRAGPNLNIFGHGGSGGLLPSSTWSTRSVTRT